MKEIFVICYKEYVAHDGFDGGVFEYGYTNEADAIEKIWKITDNLMNKFLDNKFLDEVDEEHCYRETNDSGSWQMVRANENTYEYWTKVITVEL